MIRDKSFIKGKVTATVRTADGQIKRFKPGFFRRLVGMPGKLMICVNHNIVTNEGDALIADLMANTPARQKLDNSHAYIEVGTAYIGSTGEKAATGCNTPSGSREAMESGYPQLKAAWGEANDNVVCYRAIFEAGDLNATIDEAALMNASSDGDCLAYAEVSPAAVVASTDTLQIDWELTFLGA
jgi:hypothetical protein